MRRVKWLVATLVMLLLMVCGNTETAEAFGAQYRYCEKTDVEGTAPRKVWLKNNEEIAGNPDKMERDSYVTIEVTPDEGCAAYLATFDESTVRVTVAPGVTVTFGSESKRASIQWLTCNNANVTVWAENGEYTQEGFLDGSVYGVSVYNSNIDFHGNIQYLCLGDEFLYGEGEECVNGGTVNVDGKVFFLGWNKTTAYPNGTQDTVYYKGFTGSASVTGRVHQFKITEILHSNTLNTDLKATTGQSYDLDSFAMTDGVLSEAVNSRVETLVPDMETFYFELTPSGTEENRTWHSTARYPSGEETGVSREITKEEAEEILNSGYARVVLLSSSDTVDLSQYDLAELKVYGGTVIAGSVTASEGSGGTGLVQITSYGEDTINVTVLGDVNKLTVNFTRHNPNMNITVGGTVANGQISKFTKQSDRHIGMGTFAGTNMNIVTDGIWNPALFLSLGEAEYHPVDDFVLDNLLELKKNVEESAGKISEMADMIVTEMNGESLESLKEDTKFQEAMSGFSDVQALIGVGIELSKYKYNESTGEVSDRQEVTELNEEKPLPFTVKIPKGKYNPNKKYVIVREHGTGEDKQMDVLVPEREGDKLTFQTNKFSSFTIVETAPDAFQEDEKIGAVKSASLELTDSIAIIYEGIVVKEKLSEGDVVTAKITYRDAGTILSGTRLANDLVRDGKTYAVYKFKFTDILPQFADENVKFELLLNGDVIACKEEYSVKAYCTSMLSKENYKAFGYSEEKSANFRAMLVNMLYYADAIKGYLGMTQTLTEGLTDAQKEYRTTGATDAAINKMNLTGSKDDPYCFRSAELVLKDKVNVKLTFTAKELENLSLSINFGGEYFVYKESDFESLGENKYSVMFDKIYPTQYETELTACFLKNGEQQTQVLTYSVGTYVARRLESVSENMKNVLKTMYEFGDSAKKYKDAQ